MNVLHIEELEGLQSPDWVDVALGAVTGAAATVAVWAGTHAVIEIIAASALT